MSTSRLIKKQIPIEIIKILKILHNHKFQAYIVGGCLRDLFLDKKPKDWDIATDATPEQILELFKKRAYYENKFGTVTVLTSSEDKFLKKIEITTFRIEGEYEDKRRPKHIKWAKSIEEDLKRRDFTINAIAAKPLDDLGKLKIKNKEKSKKLSLEIVDPFNGIEDIKKKLIKAVGDPYKRFKEDALRLIRAVRFLVCLENGWNIEKNTKKAIKENSYLIKFISYERIRDEFIKIIMAKDAIKGIEELRKLDLLKYILPELLEGYKVRQSKHHIYDVYTHNILSLDYACKNNFPLEVRLAALFHDIGKPRTKKGEGKNATFYGHELVGAKMTKKILERFRFDRKTIEKITKLVRWHLFYYDIGKVTESSIRKLIRKVGKENIDDLVKLRMADRIGSGVKKALPYRLRHFMYMVEKVSQDPISVKMLKINGNDVMKILNEGPSPKIGWILQILLGMVIESPQKNKKEILKEAVLKLKKLDKDSLKDLAERSKNLIEKIELKKEEMTKKKYWLV